MFSSFTACDRTRETSDLERPTRLVLVTLDTLRADRLPAAPGATPSMPATHAFAARGARFSNAWAASSATQPTHATLFTGLHPWEHGVPRNGTVLVDDHTTLAERLADAGWYTVAVVASFPLDPRFGFDQGFDRYDTLLDRRLTRSWEGEAVEDGRFYALDDVVLERALRVLAEAPLDDQFVWLHFFDPHEPYGDARKRPLPLHHLLHQQDSDSFDDLLSLARRRYDEDVARLDRTLSRLYERLEIDGDRFETHVVVTADHGESFGEDGALGHGWRVTPEEVRVPLVIVSPRVAPGVRGDVAGSRDVHATLLALAGLAAPVPPGRDLTSKEGDAVGAAYGMTGVPVPRANGRSTHRFFARHGARLLTGDARTIREDDRGDREIDDEVDAIVGPTRVLFRRFEDQLAQAETTEALDDETRAALEALGYVR